MRGASVQFRRNSFLFRYRIMNTHTRKVRTFPRRNSLKIKALRDDNFRFLFSHCEFKINLFAFSASFQVIFFLNPLLYNFFFNRLRCALVVGIY